MRLRPELLLVPVVAGAIWLVLEPRDARSSPAPELAHEQVAEAPDLGQSLLSASGPDGCTAGGTRAPLPAEELNGLTTLPLAATSRGRLVDAATLEPIPEALVVAHRNHAWTDARGRFDAGEPLDGLEELLVLNVTRSTAKHSVPRERWKRAPDGWQVPLEIGPTFRLRFQGVEVADPTSWQGRLARPERDEGWLGLRAGPPPYLRFEEPLPSSPSDAARLEFQSVDELLEGVAEAPGRLGIHEVVVVCRARAALRGRVLDGLGRPRDGIQVSDVQLGETSTETLSAFTGADGGYQLGASQPGRMRLLFSVVGETRRRELELEVPRGLTHAEDLVWDPLLPAGSIRGRLECRSGRGPIEGSLWLRALDGTGYEQSGRFKSPDPTCEFEFKRIPPGRFELSLERSRGFRWSPATLELQAPAQELVFFREDEVGSSAYTLELVDADSGALLPRGLVRSRMASSPVEDQLTGPTFELPRGVAFEWHATAAGHRLASGTERDFVERDGRFVARAVLSPGFVVWLQLSDWSRREFSWGRSHSSRGQSGGGSAYASPARLDGAEILADGVRVAVTDELGHAVLDLGAEPERIEVRLSGWRALPPFFRPREQAARSSITFLMVRE
ncbi:MAG: carboxypeptidase regulatory-like domain-containing protein [Planctomycetes bacterium]|nr:carboxypeptidase regulatory-like domain-containing protein [Planctomycetota bacterium]